MPFWRDLRRIMPLVRFGEAVDAPAILGLDQQGTVGSPPNPNLRSGSRLRTLGSIIPSAVSRLTAPPTCGPVAAISLSGIFMQLLLPRTHRFHCQTR
jgi:hypothetical protein